MSRVAFRSLRGREDEFTHLGKFPTRVFTCVTNPNGHCCIFCYPDSGLSDSCEIIYDGYRLSCSRVATTCTSGLSDSPNIGKVSSDENVRR